MGSFLPNVRRSPAAAKTYPHTSTENRNKATVEVQLLG